MESAASIQIDQESAAPCSLVSHNIVPGKGKILLEHDREYAINTITRFYEVHKSPLSDNIQVYQYNSITVHGTQYKPGTNNSLLISLDDSGQPQFAKLSKIWFAPYNKPFCVVMFTNTNSFCERLNAFEILEPEEAQGYDVSHFDLFYDRVYHAHKKSGTVCQYIVCRESVLAL